MQEHQLHLGGEVGVYDLFFGRTGYLFDYNGERYEWHVGAGFKLVNHLHVDFYYIYSPEGYMKPLLRRINPEKSGSTGARHGQAGISLRFTKMLRWEPRDLFPFDFFSRRIEPMDPATARKVVN
jgi:hypothetical protein